MKNRTTLFLGSLAVMTGATLILSARDQTSKTNQNNQSAEPAVVAPETPADAPAKAAPPPPAATKATRPGNLSFGLDEVVKMEQSGVVPEVILTYIDNSTVPYYLTADDVVRLHEAGVPAQITAALIRHGGKLREQQAQANKESQAAVAQQAPAAPNYPTASSYAAPAPPPAYVNYNYNYPAYSYSAYPAWAYSYPYYSYSYATYPGFYFSYSHPFSYRYYHPYHGYSGRYCNPYPCSSGRYYCPRPFHSGLSVGVNYGRFNRSAPGIHARVRF